VLKLPTETPCLKKPDPEEMLSCSWVIHLNKPLINDYLQEASPLKLSPFDRLPMELDCIVQRSSFTIPYTYLKTLCPKNITHF